MSHHLTRHCKAVRFLVGVIRLYPSRKGSTPPPRGRRRVVGSPCGPPRFRFSRPQCLVGEGRAVWRGCIPPSFGMPAERSNTKAIVFFLLLLLLPTRHLLRLHTTKTMTRMQDAAGVAYRFIFSIPKWGPQRGAGGPPQPHPLLLLLFLHHVREKKKRRKKKMGCQKCGRPHRRR